MSRGLHLNPGEEYKFTCSHCKYEFTQSGVGDNTLVVCPRCGERVR